MRRRNHDSRRQKAKTSEEAVIKLHIDEYLYKGNDFKDILLSFHRGVVLSQIGCTDFKSSKKSLDVLDFFKFFGFFLIFRILRIFWIFSDFFGVRGLYK